MRISDLKKDEIELLMLRPPNSEQGCDSPTIFIPGILNYILDTGEITLSQAVEHSRITCERKRLEHRWGSVENYVRALLDLTAYQESPEGKPLITEGPEGTWKNTGMRPGEGPYLIISGNYTAGGIVYFPKSREQRDSENDAARLRMDAVGERYREQKSKERVLWKRDNVSVSLKSTKKARLSFRDRGCQMGMTLYLIKDSLVTCIVRDLDRASEAVEFEGNLMSLSAATREALNVGDSQRNGSEYWSRTKGGNSLKSEEGDA